VLRRFLPVLALAIYGFIRFGQQAFCDQLGVTPEEIGLTYAASVSRAAVLIVVFTSFAGLIIAGSVFTALAAPNRGLALLKWPIALLIYGSGAAAAAWLFGWAVAFALMLLIFPCASLYPAAFRTSTLTWDEWLESSDRAPMSNPPSNYWPGVVVALLCVGLFFVSAYVGRSAASRVKDGQSVSLGEGLGLLGIRGAPVTLVGTVPKDINQSGRNLVYLGRADSVIVLYDARSKGVLRIPSDGITVIYK
jgi:hypothetical protein